MQLVGDGWLMALSATIGAILTLVGLVITKRVEARKVAYDGSESMSRATATMVDTLTRRVEALERETEELRVANQKLETEVWRLRKRIQECGINPDG